MKMFQKTVVLLGVICSMSIAVCGCGDAERTINKWLTSTDDLESQALKITQEYLRDIKAENPKLKEVAINKLLLFKKGDAYNGALYLTGPKGKKVQVEVQVEFDGKYVTCSFKELNEILNEFLRY